jgi:flagellar motor switch protein FliN
MSKFITGWIEAAGEILEQELGEPANLLPGAAIPATATSFTLLADIAGEWSGSFVVTIDASAWAALISEAEAGKQDGSAAPSDDEARQLWQDLFRKITMAAAAELGKQCGAACEVAMISPGETPAGGGMGYQLHARETMVALVLSDLVERAQSEPTKTVEAAVPSAKPVPAAAPARPAAAASAADSVPSPSSFGGKSPSDHSFLDAKGIELLLDVELEASLRFGSRELTLSDLLALGPGDVVQLDRALADPVDLVVGDKIVARGEVVLVNGNFGLQVSEVAEPRKSLESIRCLF